LSPPPSLPPKRNFHRPILPFAPPLGPVPLFTLPRSSQALVFACKRLPDFPVFLISVAPPDPSARKIFFILFLKLIFASFLSAPFDKDQVPNAYKAAFLCPFHSISWSLSALSGDLAFFYMSDCLTHLSICAAYHPPASDVVFLSLRYLGSFTLSFFGFSWCFVSPISSVCFFPPLFENSGAVCFRSQRP